MTDLDDLTGRWAAGWAASRGLPLTVDADGWHAVVRDRYRSTERITTEPSGAVAARLVDEVRGRPEAWLTVVGEPAPAAARHLAALHPPSRVEHLMHLRPCVGSPAGAAPPVDGPVVRLLVDGDVVHALVEVDGVPAARGQAVTRDGTLVVDKVSTEPEFRRRGLGGRVMAALTADGLARGARDALLVASAEGRALYVTLGWADAARVRTWVGAPPRA